jgi:hypothetical protein
MVWIQGFGSTAGPVDNGSFYCIPSNYEPEYPTLQCMDSAGVHLMPYGKCVATGIKQARPLNVQVYPNPAHDRLRIEGLGKMTLRITDMTGQIMLMQSFTGNTDIPLNTLKNGLYIYHLFTEDGRQKAETLVKE